ncbi:MAG: hypothetical protein DRI73_00180 [Bacteroidetes bacterium]|nr:MAG: hypothetical protein DRI73_00180 [Bacteroidota bacterium]
MKRNLIYLIVLSILILSCNNRQYYIENVDNPQFIENKVFLSFEDLTSPKFEALKEKYQLDTIFHGEKDEFKRILLLRQWIKSVIPIDNVGDPYPGSGHVDSILDAALDGVGFHCGHFMKVQNAVMNAYGYVTRTLGAGPGVKGGPDGHHGINEIWLNDYNKWFLSDAKYDIHFEKEGIPLSALEIRDEYIKNKASDIVKVKGPERKIIDIDPETGTSKERSAQTYTWIEWHTYNNMFTVWPDFVTLLNVYEDEYFEKHTWIWGGKPHWAYNTEYFRLIKDRGALYWTPNTIRSKVQIEGHNAIIELTSDTANLKEYQMKNLPSTDWQAVSDTVRLKLEKSKYELIFRTLNLANIAGPEHKIIIDSK